MRGTVQHGFTLLELLVAVAVLALLASITFRGLGSILDTEAHVQAEARRWNDVARVMEQMSRDFSLAVDRPALEAAGRLLIRRLGENDGGALHAGPRQVGYQLRDGTLEYLAWSAAALPAGAPPIASAVLGNINSLELRALGPDGAWEVLSPAARQAGHFPRAVEVQIVLAGGERITRLFPLR